MIKKSKNVFQFFYKLVRCEGFPFFCLGTVGKVGLIPGGLRPGTKLTGYLLMTLIHFLMLWKTRLDRRFSCYDVLK